MSLFPRKRKKETGPRSPTLPEVENEKPTSTSTPDSYDVGTNEANKTSESVEPFTQEVEGSPESRQQVVGSGNFPQRDLQSTNSGSSIGYCTGESFTSLAEASSSRPRVGSTGSSVYSFHTARSSPLPSRGDGRRREAVVEEEAKQWFLSMRDELLGLMREIREKVNELERKVDNIDGKVDNIEQKLESRVEGVEKQIQNIYSDIMPSPTRLSSLTEVEEENTDKETKDLEKSSQLQQKPKRVIGPLRKMFTDTDFLKVSHYRQLLTKRKTFTQQKALSVQDSRRQLPQKQCSQQVIVWLTQRITHWKFIARWLGLQDSDVETIATNNPQDVREQCYQMFKKWRSTDPGNFTYHVLGEALRREGQVKLFNEYVEEVHRVENTIDVPDHD